ncbi:autophagy protein Apg17-domain-containing protein [Crepidotus variabilis]|uniref:Autophagy-related protein 17 n=1 Tax=Crepidotus variabilis TaxID=179855 RepID=A0A9P6EAX0_9AGAR|nr:autophagy protein Apg17-domain-containing protein [Crepidotus variabilis]
MAIGRRSATGSPLSPPRAGAALATSPINSSSPSAFAIQRPLGSPSLPLTPEALQIDLEHPHLVTLVLLSKKALQHGEHLCTLAHTSSNTSFQSAVDVLALDAKVKWLSGEVLEQLKLVANVAKAIEEKRNALQNHMDEWDSARSKHTDALDSILDILGKQLVPPEFHQMSADSSLFGSQPGLNLTEEGGGGQLFGEPTSQDAMASPLIGFGIGNSNDGVSTSPVSPSSTLRRAEPLRRYSIEGALNGVTKDKNKHLKQNDRRHWKTLRDFIDDQAIEDTLDIIESDRSALDNILATTDDYPETLYQTISTIEAALPSVTYESSSSFPFSPVSSEASILQLVHDIIAGQEGLVRNMANTLENLASHYDGMATALKENEGGEVFSEDEMNAMSRDTEELRMIMHEMERDMEGVQGYQSQLTEKHATLSTSLSTLSSTLNTLDALGDILEEMLTTQDITEHSAQEALAGLQYHLTTLEELHRQFEEYRVAFDRLLVEIQRRRIYRDAVEEIVRGMGKELIALTQEEERTRSSFNSQYGSYLPEDLCLSIANAPTKWEVLPCDETRSLEFELGFERESSTTTKPVTRRTETLPWIEKDLVDTVS